MDELYNEVCDIIQEQYNCGDITEEDATALMEAAYDRYVTESEENNDTEDTKKDNEKKESILKELERVAHDADDKISKFLQDGKLDQALNEAKSAYAYFVKKKGDLKKDINRLKTVSKHVGRAGVLVAAGADVKKFINDKDFRRENKLAKKELKEAKKMLKTSENAPTASDVMKLQERRTKKIEDAKAERKVRNRGMNITIFGTLIGASVAKALLTRLPRKLDMYIAHFKREVSNLEKIKNEKK